MDTAEKIYENRMRRTAERQGLRLVKSRRRDPRAYDFGVYWLVDENNVIENGEQGMSLDEIDVYLSS